MFMIAGAVAQNLQNYQFLQVAFSVDQQQLLKKLLKSVVSIGPFQNFSCCRVHSNVLYRKTLVSTLNNK